MKRALCFHCQVWFFQSLDIPLRSHQWSGLSYTHVLNSLLLMVSFASYTPERLLGLSHILLTAVLKKSIRASSQNPYVYLVSPLSEGHLALWCDYSNIHSCSWTALLRSFWERLGPPASTGECPGHPCEMHTAPVLAGQISFTCRRRGLQPLSKHSALIFFMSILQQMPVITVCFCCLIDRLIYQHQLKSTTMQTTLITEKSCSEMLEGNLGPLIYGCIPTAVKTRWPNGTP